MNQAIAMHAVIGFTTNSSLSIDYRREPAQAQPRALGIRDLLRLPGLLSY